MSQSPKIIYTQQSTHKNTFTCNIRYSSADKISGLNSEWIPNLGTSTNFLSVLLCSRWPRGALCSLQICSSKWYTTNSNNITARHKVNHFITNSVKRTKKCPFIFKQFSSFTLKLKLNIIILLFILKFNNEIPIKPNKDN